ncbi:MAG: hypothetical protein NVSMB6_05030 [Burkholderiaceae bacterium]
MVFSNGQTVEQFVDAHHDVSYRSTLLPGVNEVHHDALFVVSASAHDAVLSTQAISRKEMPPEVLRYVLPSHYCDCDKIGGFADERFDHLSGRREHVTWKTAASQALLMNTTGAA